MILWCLLAVVAAEWHRLGLGVPHSVSFIGESNDTIVLSDNQVARVDGYGNIVWRQPVNAQQVEVGKHAYVLSGSTLNALDLSTGSKEWSYPNVDSFAPANDSVVIAAAGQWAFIQGDWQPITKGHQLVTCRGQAYFKQGDALIGVGSSSIEMCTPRVPDISIHCGVVCLSYEGVELWTLHEGLSEVEAACFISKVHEGAALDETWKQRVARHSRFISKVPEPARSLLVVATRMGSVYALDVSNGSILWFHHNVFKEGEPVEIKQEHNLVAIEVKTVMKKVLYQFDGALVSDLNNSAPKAEALHGYTFETSRDAVHGLFNSQKTWEFSSSGVEIISVTKRPQTNPASLAYFVNGAYDFYYKYLNPNLIVVTGQNTTHTDIYLLDAISGRPLGSKTYAACGPVWITLGEHWVAYSIANKFYVLQLFETSSLNVRKTEPIVSALEDELMPYIVEHSFDVSSSIQALGVSTTTFGVTAQCILIANSNGQILAIDENLLSLQQSTGLDYGLDSSVVSGHNSVHGVTRFACQATMFESSFAVAALGKDIFYTVHAPHGTFDQLPTNYSYASIICTLLVVSHIAYQLYSNYMQQLSQARWA